MPYEAVRAKLLRPVADIPSWGHPILMCLLCILLAACLTPFLSVRSEDFSAWSGHGSVWLLTDKEGANLPVGCFISYLDSKNWSQDRLVMGANGLPALTFRSVPIR